MAEVVNLVGSDVFLAFATYTTIVILKMMLMSPMTVYYRLSKKAFTNPEDTFGSVEERKRMSRVDPDVERVRRCHLNDLENIVPFVVIGLLYSLTGPDLSTALLHFRLFVGSRLVHTVVYVMALPQPIRAVVYVVGLGTTISMACCVLAKVFYL